MKRLSYKPKLKRKSLYRERQKAIQMHRFSLLRQFVAWKKYFLTKKKEKLHTQTRKKMQMKCALRWW